VTYTYYVDSVNGSDSNPGTLTEPWQTIAKVNSTTLTPGQSVGFASGGVWLEMLTPANSGAPGNPITFGSYGSGALPSLTSLSVTSLGWLTFNGLRFTRSSTAVNPTGEGVTLNAATNVTLTNCQMDNNANTGIGIGQGSYNVLISGGSTFGNGTNISLDGGGIGIGEVGAASYNITIQNTTISDGINVSNTSTNAFPYNILLTGNILGNPVGNGLLLEGGTVTAEYNVISGSAGSGIEVDPSSGSTANLTAYNNTIYNNNGYGIAVVQVGSGVGSIIFKNNLLSANNPTQNWVDFGWISPSAITLISDYNLFYHNASHPFAWFDTLSQVYTTLAQWQTATSQDMHSVSANPLLNNPGGGDFTLQSGSPAIGTGVYIPGVSTAHPPNMGSK